MPALKNDPAWVRRAFKDLGLKEYVGKKHNPRVIEMFKLAGHSEITDDETAWCSAAVNAWMAEAGIKGTGALNARSWLKWGKVVPTSDILPRGTVLVFPRGNSSWQGHVGLCVGDDGKTLKVLGGNQSNSVSVVNYKKSSLLGARWPETVQPVKLADAEDIPPPPDIEPEPVQASASGGWFSKVKTWGTTALGGGLGITGLWDNRVWLGLLGFGLVVFLVVWFTPSARQRVLGIFRRRK